MDTKFFRLPFAVSGTRTAIPDPVQGDGSVSYTSGYGLDYALDPGSDPSALLIERAKFNELMFDITSSLAKLQQDYPQWISSGDNGGSPFAYNIGVVVRYSDGSLYQSNSNANTGTPGGAGWTLFLSQYATTTQLNAEIARAMAAEALLAPLASPALTGTPTAPTASPGINTTQLATTAFVTSAVAAETARAIAAEALLAPLASPALTGNPTAPTQATGNNSTRLATTAFVTAAVAVETGRALAAEALLAPLASPAFTGVPAAPTAAPGTNTTQLATTAFVLQNSLPVGSVLFFSTPTAPPNYILAEGQTLSRAGYPLLNGVAASNSYNAPFGPGDGSTTFDIPDLRGYFIRGWSDGGSVDPGRAFGSIQADDVGPHTHQMRYGDNNSPTTLPGHGGGTVLTNQATLQNTSSGETRVKNVALAPCIKYQ